MHNWAIIVSNTNKIIINHCNEASDCFRISNFKQKWWYFQNPKTRKKQKGKKIKVVKKITKFILVFTGTISHPRKSVKLRSFFFFNFFLSSSTCSHRPLVTPFTFSSFGWEKFLSTVSCSLFGSKISLLQTFLNFILSR